MSKYNVKIDLWGYFDEVEAETGQDAMKETLLNVINDKNDFFTDYEAIVERLLDNLQNSCSAEEVESEE